MNGRLPATPDTLDEDDLILLLLKCWSPAESRPSIALCEQALVSATMLLDRSRRDVLTASPSYLALIKAGLEDPSIGVRHSALQCIRVLSRSINMVCTSLAYSGLGWKVWELVSEAGTRLNLFPRLIIFACTVEKRDAPAITDRPSHMLDQSVVGFQSFAGGAYCYAHAPIDF